VITEADTCRKYVLQAQAELDALLPSVLDQAFRGGMNRMGLKCPKRF
jgi:hypothetical protein